MSPGGDFRSPYRNVLAFEVSHTVTTYQVDLLEYSSTNLGFVNTILAEHLQAHLAVGVSDHVVVNVPTQHGALLRLERAKYFVHLDSVDTTGIALATA
jgi:hypothetical protein